jgi:methionine synthase II (cobalamin-independent)
MADYDPRTATGIPTEPVGSLPRPSWLQRAYAQYDAGEITRDQLEAEQDKAVRDSIEHQEETGTPIISDGEQRWSSFATYAITDTLDPRNPWTGRNMLPHFIELNNRVLDRFTAQERASIGIHTCPGGDRDSVHSADVPYSDLLPSMFGINAGYFLIQLASERDKDRVYQLIGEHLRTDANGVTQTAYIGVINPLNPRVESPEEVGIS